MSSRDTRPIWAGVFAVGLLAAALALPQSVHAVPSFARQTGLACEACPRCSRNSRRSAAPVWCADRAARSHAHGTMASTVIQARS